MGDANNFYTFFQIPIFFTMLILMWAVIGVRLAVFLKNFTGWRSFRGASMMLILMAGSICIVYVALLLAEFFINKRCIAITTQPMPGATGAAAHPDPADFSDSLVQTVIDIIAELAKLIYASRFLLTAALWLVKIAFLFIFLETRETLGRGVWFLYASSLFIIITFPIALWDVGKDMSEGIPGFVLSPDVVRTGVVNTGLRFILFDIDVEYLLAAMSIATDLCLVIIAWRTVRSFRLPLREVLLPSIMVAATILVTVSRLVAAVLVNRINGPVVQDYTIFLELSTELETFLAVIIACFPGLRQFVRSKKAKDDSLKALRGVGRGELTGVQSNESTQAPMIEKPPKAASTGGSEASEETARKSGPRDPYEIFDLQDVGRLV